eukprot:SAG11_NODE_852_length_6874_cov_2.914391_4_plen_115_part_01
MVEARDTGVSKRLVAIKVVKPDGGKPRFSLSEERALKREYQATAFIAHANVVTCFDYSMGCAKSACYQVLELVRGLTLEEALAADGAMPEAKACDCCMQVLRCPPPPGSPPGPPA